MKSASSQPTAGAAPSANPARGSQMQGSALNVPARTPAAKNPDPSPTSTATTEKVAGDNASTASKKKRRREESGAQNAPGARKPGGVSRLFGVFLCCRGSSGKEDDTPGPRTASPKRESVPAPKAAPVAKSDIRDSGVGASKEQVQAEKVPEPVVASSAAAAITEKKQEEEKPKAPIAAPAVGPEAAARENDAADKPERINSPAPIQVSIQSPTPTVSPGEDTGPPPEAPFPPTPSNDDATDSDTVEEEDRSRRKEEATQVALPTTSSSEKSVAPTEEETEETGPHDGALVESAGTERQQWLLPPLRPEFNGKKCLVLDLDETLVHSSFKVSTCMHGVHYTRLSLTHD